MPAGDKLFPPRSVATIREATGLSESRFASLLGVSVRTLQDWEQGRRAPSGAARTLFSWPPRVRGPCSTLPRLGVDHSGGPLKSTPVTCRGQPPAHFETFG
jgi:hypothetical protein